MSCTVTVRGDDLRRLQRTPRRRPRRHQHDAVVSATRTRTSRSAAASTGAAAQRRVVPAHPRHRRARGRSSRRSARRRWSGERDDQPRRRLVLACLSQAVPARAAPGYGGCNAQPVGQRPRPAAATPFTSWTRTGAAWGARRRARRRGCLSFPRTSRTTRSRSSRPTYPVRIERVRDPPGLRGAGPAPRRPRAGQGLPVPADARVECRVTGRSPPFGLAAAGPGALTEYVR